MDFLTRKSTSSISQSKHQKAVLEELLLQVEDATELLLKSDECDKIRKQAALANMETEVSKISIYNTYVMYFKTTTVTL